jgi:hypothetical protein
MSLLCLLYLETAKSARLDPAANRHGRQLAVAQLAKHGAGKNLSCNFLK